VKLAKKRRWGLALAGAAVAAGITAATLGTGTGQAATSASTQQVQWDLAGMAYLSFGDIDGQNDATTQAAVKAFQADRCLAVDGIAGQETNAELAAQVTKIQAVAGAPQDGMYGPNTEAAVKSWQSGHGLTASGQADAATMTAMGVERAKASCAPPPPGEIAASIVSIAQQEAANTAHNREIGGYNCNFYTTALGLAGTGAHCSNSWKSEAWCADFAKWVWIQAGVDTTYATAAALSFETYGQKHGTWHTGSPQPGDAIVFGYGHVGLVVSATSSTVSYVSGNTYNPADGADDAVLQKTVSRSYDQILGYSTPIPK
jgi:peptidoglycan hydrolase-like protein with peptidoglycan-binding domain